MTYFYSFVYNYIFLEKLNSYYTQDPFITGQKCIELDRSWTDELLSSLTKNLLEF